ncbi:MAG: O-antigen ligase [Phormidesmis sp.]
MTRRASIGEQRGDGWLGEMIATRPRQAHLAMIEKGYSVFAWLFFSNGVATILNNSDVVLKLLRYGILLFAVLLLAARWKGTLNALSKGGLLWILVAMMILSLGWSFSPTYTMESIRGEVLPTTVFALYFSSRFNPREQMQILAIALSIGALLSLFYAIAIPSVGKHIGDKFDGAWKGIYAQKNSFSTTMTLTMLLFFVLGIVNRPGLERTWARIGLVAAMGMIILSTSKSGLLIFIAMLVVVAITRMFRWQGRRSVLVLDLSGLFFSGAIAGLSATWQNLAIDLGKDPTLSGRTHIWAGSIDKIMDHPWLGYGRSAFWVPDSLPAIEVGALTGSVGFVPAHAHNGFIDVAIELGLLGFGVFMLGLLITYVIAIRRAYKAQVPEDLWPFAFITLMVMSNLTESILMYRVTLYWVLYMVIFLSLRIWPQGYSQQPNPQMVAIDHI